MPLTAEDFKQLSALIVQAKKLEADYTSDLQGVLSFRRKDQTLLDVTQSYQARLEVLGQSFAEVMTKDDGPRKVAALFQVNFSIVCDRVSLVLTLFNRLISLPFVEGEKEVKTSIATSITGICERLKGGTPSYVAVSSALSNAREIWIDKIWDSMRAERQARLEREVQERQRVLHESIGSVDLRSIVRDMPLDADPEVLKRDMTLGAEIPKDLDKEGAVKIKGALVVVVANGGKKQLASISDDDFFNLLLAIRSTKDLNMVAGAWERRATSMSTTGFSTFQNSPFVTKQTMSCLSLAAALRFGSLESSVTAGASVPIASSARASSSSVMSVPPPSMPFAEIIANFRNARARLISARDGFYEKTKDVAEELKQEQAAAERAKEKQVAEEREKAKAIEKETEEKAAAERAVMQQRLAEQQAAEKKRMAAERERIAAIDEEAQGHLKSLDDIEARGYVSEEDEQTCAKIGAFLEGRESEDDTEKLKSLRAKYRGKKITEAFTVGDVRVKNHCEDLRRSLKSGSGTSAVGSFREIEEILRTEKDKAERKDLMSELRTLYEAVQLKQSCEKLLRERDDSEEAPQEADLALVRSVKAVLDSEEGKTDRAELMMELRALHNAVQKKLGLSLERPTTVDLSVSELRASSAAFFQPAGERSSAAASASMESETKPVSTAAETEWSPAEVKANSYIGLLRGAYDSEKVIERETMLEIHGFLSDESAKSAKGEVGIRAEFYDNLNSWYLAAHSKFSPKSATPS